MTIVLQTYRISCVTTTYTLARTEPREVWQTKGTFEFYAEEIKPTEMEKKIFRLKCQY